eukprot:symbB.v1.2.039985.t1/scaffold6918.1/size14605/1
MLHEARNGYMEKDVTSLLPNFFADEWRDDWRGERSWNPLEPHFFSTGLPPPVHRAPPEWNERAERTPSPLRRMDWAETFVGNSGRGRMEVPDVGIIGQAVGADRRAGQGTDFLNSCLLCEKHRFQHRKMAMASWPGPASLGQLMPTVPGRRKQLKPKQPKPLALMAYSPGTRWCRVAMAALPPLRWCLTRSQKASRRKVFLWPLLICSRPARAEVTLADVSNGIMGGDRDVYYPSWFLGEWEATTELVSVEFPQGEEMVVDKDAVRQRQLLNTKQAVEQYPQKYIEYDGILTNGDE